METLQSLLESRLRAAVAGLGESAVPIKASVTQATDPAFGDYQTNAAMLFAKALRANPRQIAAQIIELIEVGDVCERPEIAGAGFINFRARTEVIARRGGEMFRDERLGVSLAPRRKIVIDFSSPNVAKPMHVGHIRSTILGDALTRIARFLGHEVIADNHLGDWGTQFGKVIHGWKTLLDRAALEADPVRELVRLYKTANTLAEQDPAVMQACRDELVKLQQRDPENLAIWETCVAISRREFDEIYAVLGVTFDEWLGESFYNDRLPNVVERLLASGIAEISEGAAVVFFRDLPALAGKPCLVRKGDGGFLYATNDIATIEYRMERWNPDAIWYVVGAPQQLHLAEVFEVARRMGVSAELRHIAFGSILGEDRKLMKTRSGENVPLRDLLTEAGERAMRIVEQKNAELDATEKREIARIIGIGAVKYADLSQARMTDYVFAWDRMLSLQGNTAPYLQNAYVRIRSIFRKLEGEFAAPEQLALDEETEVVLTKKLLQFAETVPLVLDDFRPNILANYLYELANTFHAFYESCPVLKAEEPVRASRLTLCDLTARVLRQGLALLGIQVPERM